MKRSLLELYALIVCFFTVGGFVITLFAVVWAVIGVSSPSLTMENVEFAIYQTDDSFRSHLIEENRNCKQDKPYEPPSAADLTAARAHKFSEALDLERRKNLRELVKDFIDILIMGGVFAVHWSIAARARQPA